ncbi:hypothetical protein JHK82_042254 [Glycine max]|uniref:Uncharacterized protein n=1 Tax=Glycine soja TaxID=3848 RepID=A0A0B2QTP7_GLYSO|nr:hypothetical protein JHK82_042254 [Glycine max]KAG5116406.1 hypothetical protein JHK84_042519 [Glycine max]KHN24850.1 hypothetical protein glysoja_040970 [Glycine soja]
MICPISMTLTSKRRLINASPSQLKVKFQRQNQRKRIEEQTNEDVLEVVVHVKFPVAGVASNGAVAGVPVAGVGLFVFEPELERRECYSVELVVGG